MPASLKQIGARNMFQKFQNAILLAPVVENLLELATIAFMLNYSKSFLPVHYERPISGMAFPVADDEGFGQSQIPLPLMPPIKSANCLCFKLSSKLCLNCNLTDSPMVATFLWQKSGAVFALATPPEPC